MSLLILFSSFVFLMGVTGLIVLNREVRRMRKISKSQLDEIRRSREMQKEVSGMIRQLELFGNWTNK